ncbi:Vacuolar protein sorting-associated protein 5 [Actinomortierella ambigua]|nr:Vacuolar protein sorting-associated protein 5 [Actinomortierella ambigua]
MSSPPESISDLLGTTRSAPTGGDGGDDSLTSASAFLDPTFSLQNPFAEDAHPSGFPATSPVLRPSQSLNFHETYTSSTTHGFGVSSQPEPTTTATVDHSDNEDSDDDDNDEGRHRGDPAVQRSSTFHKSFSAMNLASSATGGYPTTETTPTASGGDGGGEREGDHARWGGVDVGFQHHQASGGFTNEPLDDQDLDEDEESGSPVPRTNVSPRRPETTMSIHSQMSLRLPESGAIPWFEITVGEPHKVSDAINPYIVYKVRVKTNSTAFKSNDFTVQRRYRDFLWLYNQLTAHNPGVIVPPVSEKHALGRFQDEFVESRRIALERCLRKITAHPMLYGDPDLKLFLESDSLEAEIKVKRADNSKGFMTKFGETLSSATTFTKVQETDEWFESRRTQLDVLETQLKTLLKAVEAIIKQRKDLGQASAEFGESIVSLAGTELNKPLANSLLVLGNLKIKIKELHDRQAHMDVLTLEHTADEYIRTMGSIKIALMARAKYNQAMVQAQNDLAKKKANYEKQAHPSRKTKPERLQQMQQEITEAEQKVEVATRDFDEISSLIRQEFDRFDREKIEDFKQSVEAFLASMVKHQREIVGLWENYFKALNGAMAEEEAHRQREAQVAKERKEHEKQIKMEEETRQRLQHEQQTATTAGGSDSANIDTPFGATAVTTTTTTTTIAPLPAAASPWGDL